MGAEAPFEIKSIFIPNSVTYNEHSMAQNDTTPSHRGAKSGPNSGVAATKFWKYGFVCIGTDTHFSQIKHVITDTNVSSTWK